MDNHKNEDIKEDNEICFKEDIDINTNNNKVNPKLLLFKSNGIFKRNLFIENPKKSVNFKFSRKQNNSANNISIIHSKSNDKNSKKNFFINRRKRPFFSNYEKKNINQMFNPTTFRGNYSNSSIDPNNIEKSVNKKQRDNSLNIITKSKINANNKENKIYPSTSFHYQNNSLRITIKLKNSSNPSDYHSVRYFNNKNNMLNQESQNNSIIPSAFEKITSTKDLNIHSIQPRSENKTKNNFFRHNLNSINSNNIKNNNSNDLILYKNVIYSNTRNKRKNNLINKLRNYNDIIRKRNDKKNIKCKSQEKSTQKRYSFYKYEEYMDKINKEEINEYKYKLNKMKEINIQEIFKDTIKSYQNKLNDKTKTTNKEDLSQSSHSLVVSNLLSSKSTNNSKDSKENSINKYIRIPIKKSESPRSKYKNRKDNIDDTSSEMPMIMGDYEVKKSGIRKLKRTLTMINLQNTYIKKFKNENILLDSDNSIENSPKIFSEQINQINQIKKKDFLNLSDNIEKEKRNHKIKDIEFDTIKTIEIKDNAKKKKDNEILENLRKKYYQKREKLIKVNRRNLLAKKLLLEKISQMDKKDETKSLSKFSPFANLNYKYKDKDTEKETNERKKNIYEKYYKKNQDKNKFSVRLKNKSSMSFLTNNSINTSHFNFMKEFNEQKSEFSSIHEVFKDENFHRNDNENDLINFDSNENIFNIKEIEDIDNKINFEENKKEIDENKKIEEEKKLKIKLDEEKLNEMIKEEKKKKFEQKFFQNYEKILKSQEKKEEKMKQKLINDEILQELSHNFFNLLEENEKIIKSSTKKEDTKLFIEFREKMNSLKRYSKRELNLYLYRNFKTINTILEECKRDKQIEFRINKFLKLLRDDLCINRKSILQFIKAIDYKPFQNLTMDIK